MCTGDGLILDVPGVTLDFNGKKLRGSGNGVGVRIAADGVTVRNGQVFTFGTGISGATDGSTINKVKSYYNSGDGIFLDGNWNTVKSQSRQDTTATTVTRCSAMTTRSRAPITNITESTGYS